MTDDDNRRHRAKQHWPPTLCVGGPVITQAATANYSLAMSGWPACTCLVGEHPLKAAADPGVAMGANGGAWG